MHPFVFAMTASLVKSVIDHFIIDLTLGTSREFTFSRVSADILLALYSPFTFSRVSADILLALYSP